MPKKLMTCIHLQPIESAIRAGGIAVAASGDWWGSGSTANVTFDCVLDRRAIERRFAPPAFVHWHEYDGRGAGHEAGFDCTQCGSLLVGGFKKYGGRRWPSG
ncbi:hypothetical protein [Montanilutibacter psychrotolerans]|uniref:Uncharacterized protein n=1 Tax=Montanilutibacter psychrotolerans TaxID=1327343 RepID=A0A3M8SUZ7_9GAMM|nr:hypothetical protein [Lysobacter psychrotolerans]RNF84515.1 hypothetical protein EER27_09140 [Lysobacter psychrotolerans]